MTSAMLRWGTSDQTTGALASYIVRSVTRRTRSETILIQDANGFTDTTVTINDGDDLEISCVDDKLVTPPAAGAVASLLVPGWAAAKNVQVTAVSQTVSQRAAGEITISAQWFTNVTLT